jgi:hypothetical protein
LAKFSFLSNLAVVMVGSEMLSSAQQAMKSRIESREDGVCPEWHSLEGPIILRNVTIQIPSGMPPPMAANKLTRLLQSLNSCRDR